MTASTDRPSVDLTLMRIAQAWEGRSTCARNHVGAVISMGGRVISTGYNGAPPGQPHCIHNLDTLQELTGVAYLREHIPDRGCRVVIHAEANAIAFAARHGVEVFNATLHTTLSPCYSCAQLIIAAGLVRVVYNRLYRDEAGLNLLESAGIPTEHLGL